MRRIGNLANEMLAERFRDYLTTQSIDSSIEAGDGEGANCDIWIRDEKDVARARTLFDQFQSDPDNEQFDATAEAIRIRQQRASDNIKKLKFRRTAPMRGPSLPGGGFSGFPTRQTAVPITIGIIVLSVVVGYLTRFARPLPSKEPGKYSFEEQLYCALSFLDPRETLSSEGIAPDAFTSIKKGELWRFVTPLVMHGSIFHLLFNMLWIYSLGSMIERLHGSIFFLVLVLITQTVGMLVQVVFPDFLGGGHNAIGASGAVYGLFGYLWIRPQVDPAFPIRIAPTNVAIMLGFFLLCFTPLIQGVANGAHLGGLIAGVAAAPLISKHQS
jgi:GlpG protein